MKYLAYVMLFSVFSMVSSAAAVIQTDTTGDYRIVLSTSPEQPLVNSPVHLELHIQSMETGEPIKNLDIKGLVIHLQEHVGTQPHIHGENISDIHSDISHRTFLEMEESQDHQPGHYHTNFSFNETGLYEMVIQFKGDGETMTSIFSLDVKSMKVKGEREPLAIRYTIFEIIAVFVIAITAAAFVLEKTGKWQKKR